MHPNSVARRFHDAEIKARVLAACKEPGASIAAVAMAHGLNANLVRKWLHGRGLKRSGLQAVAPPALAAQTAQAAYTPSGTGGLAAAQFVPVVIAGPKPASAAPQAGLPLSAQPEAGIRIELRRGLSSLTVNWPVSASADCTAWLRELAAGWLK